MNPRIEIFSTNCYSHEMPLRTHQLHFKSVLDKHGHNLDLKTVGALILGGLTALLTSASV